MKQNAKRIDIRFFAGPFADNVLKTIDAHFAESGTGLSSDYIACQTFHGWFAFISEPFAKFLYFDEFLPQSLRFVGAFNRFGNSCAQITPISA